MRYRTVPATDIEVSCLCLGTMTFGTPVGKDEAARIVHWALDHGVNFIDTADMYEGYTRFMGSPGGKSEEFLGEALQGRRKDAVVTTKAGNPVGPEPGDTGLGRVHLTRQIDASLQRLRTDYVDFYLLHRPDPETPLETSIEVMAGLVQSGKVRHWGFSNYEADQVREMMHICEENSYPKPVVSQPPYSWLNRGAEAEHLPLCRELDIAVTPYRPLEGGLLTGKYRRGGPLPEGTRATESKWLSPPDEEAHGRIEGFEHEARAAGLSPSRYAVRWLLDQAGVTSVVTGVTRAEQLEDLAAACA